MLQVNACTRELSMRQARDGRMAVTSPVPVRTPSGDTMSVSIGEFPDVKPDGSHIQRVGFAS
jgi:hypothetical protein